MFMLWILANSYESTNWKPVEIPKPIKLDFFLQKPKNIKKQKLPQKPETPKTTELKNPQGVAF